jgi:hypothetical protein
MPTIDEATKRDTTGYARIGGPSVPSHQIEEYDLPPRNVVQICSLPYLPGIFPSTNNIIDFYAGGKIPQFRAPIAPIAPSQGSATTTTFATTTTATSSSSTTTTNNPAKATSASLTTPVLAPGTAFQGTILLAKTSLLYSLAVNVPCRVELYSTMSAQTNDFSRPLGTPVGLGTNQGIISDVEMDTAPAIWYYQDTNGSNEDTPQSNVIYVTVTNLGLASTATTITITYIPLQS